MARLDGQVALVTGGARGLGEAQVRALIAQGASVIFSDILDDEGKALAAELESERWYLRLDVTDEDDWKSAVAAGNELGGIDILINNAGIVTFGGIEEIAPTDFRHVIDANLIGVYLGMHLVIPGMRSRGRGGVIINISSTAGMMGYANLAGYVASKMGCPRHHEGRGSRLGQYRDQGELHTPWPNQDTDDRRSAGLPLRRAGHSPESGNLRRWRRP